MTKMVKVIPELLRVGSIIRQVNSDFSFEPFSDAVIINIDFVTHTVVYRRPYALAMVNALSDASKSFGYEQYEASFNELDNYVEVVGKDNKQFNYSF